MNGHHHLQTVDALDPALSSSGDSTGTWNTIRHPIMHGNDVNGGPVTLIDVRRYGWASVGPRPDPQDWLVDAIVVGRHLRSADEPVTRFRFEFGTLLEWTNNVGGRIRQTTQPGSFGEELTVTSERRSLGRPTVDEHTIEVIADHALEISAHRAHIERTAYVDVDTSHAPISIRDGLERYGFAIRGLLALTTRSYASVDAVRVYLAADTPDDRRSGFASYHTELIRPARLPEPVQAFDMTMSLPAFGIPVAELLQKWMAVWARHRETIERINVPTTAPYMFADSLALTAWLAIDKYHQTSLARSDSERQDDRVAHQEKVDVVVAAAPEHLREWLTSALTYREKGQIGQPRRLEQVIARAAGTGAAITAANPHFVRDAVKVRNKVAHPANFAPEHGRQFVYISATLRWLLRHCLLAELGATDEQVTAAITRNRQFVFDVRSFEQQPGED